MSTFLTADDATLADRMRLAQDGDKEAYAFVLDRCREALGHFARTSERVGASDIEFVRRCLLTLHHARHTFDPERSFVTWIEAIARYHWIGPTRGAWRVRIGAVLHNLRQRAGCAALDTNRGQVLGTRFRAHGPPS